MITVGITGSLASGKSEVARIFKKRGAKIFDADRAAKAATRKGTPIYKAIVKIFGKKYLQRGGELDRKKLADRVFSRPDDLKKLNTLIHPGVILEFYKAFKPLKKKKGVLVLDVPLLFESKMEKLVDVIIVVASKQEKMLERAEQRGVSRALAKKILSAQWPIEKKAKLADVVIKNNGTRKDLEKAVRKIYQDIQQH